MEIWKTVIVNGEKYEDYQVSNFGNVRSLGNDRKRKTKILKPIKRKDGYLFVRLSKNGKTKNLTIHRLVSQAFIPNLLNLPQVNHRDENKLNNHVENLEYCDCKYNINYGTRNERAAATRNERAAATNKIIQTNGKLSKIVLQLTKTGELVRKWPSIAECGRNGFDNSAVAKCCRGERKSHKGFRWRYK